MHVIPNVLAARYASPGLVRLWSPEYKIALGAQDRDPQPSLQLDLVRRRPEADQLGARVARGQHVGDHVGAAYVPSRPGRE